MAMHFDRWEKDTFFPAAEEVQESADRMDSTYRAWIHSLKDNSSGYNPDELRRDLRAAHGTAKWQLEEFERAVRNSYKNAADEAKGRHRQFVLAMEEKVSVVEKSLKDSAVSDGKLLRLDEGERDEFALFLGGPTVAHGDGHQKLESCLKNKSCASGLNLMDVKVVNSPGHRRTASANANADIGSWNISVGDDCVPQNSSNGFAQPPPPRRVPSYSGFISTAVESASKLKLPKSAIRKWNADYQQEYNIALLTSQEMRREMSGCCQRSMGCLNTVDDRCNKQIHSWYGAIQRMLQRSQYQVQSGRPVQLTFWSALLLFFIVLFVLHAI